VTKPDIELGQPRGDKPLGLKGSPTPLVVLGAFGFHPADIIPHFQRSPSLQDPSGEKPSENILLLEARINELLRQANDSQGEVARPLYLDAAKEAMAIYEMPPTQGGTDSETIRRAFHGATAVNAFINAGEINDALSLGSRIIADMSIPPEFRDSVRKEIKSLQENA
jgi:hypothetical protein